MTGTGAFQLGPPPPRRSRAWLWLLIGVLVAALIVVAALGVPALLSSNDTPDNRDNPRQGTSVNNPGASAPGGAPTKTRFPRDPGDKPGRLVEVNPARYINKTAAEAAGDLTGMGLAVEVLTQAGEQPRNLDTCIVADVTPAGDRPIGSDVTIRCQQNGPPG
jgi:serine/threonine-protein kinase